jgi:hypothetical protein
MPEIGAAGAMMGDNVPPDPDAEDEDDEVILNLRGFISPLPNSCCVNVKGNNSFPIGYCKSLWVNTDEWCWVSNCISEFGSTDMLGLKESRESKAEKSMLKSGYFMLSPIRPLEE